MKKDVELLMYVKAFGKIINCMEDEIIIQEQKIKKLEKKQQITNCILIIIVIIVGIGMII